MDIAQWVDWFRQSSPYINAHRHKTVVLGISGEAFSHENFAYMTHDIALLSSLGVRIVVALGARPQIEQRLAIANLESDYHRGLRITNDTMMPCILEAVGHNRAQFEAMFSLGLVNSPMHGARIRVVSGNLVMAQPYGVLDGIDLDHTGKVRRIDKEAVRAHLDQHAIVLLPSVGYSITGEAFNLSYEEVAVTAAQSLQADKLILMSDRPGIVSVEGDLIREMGISEGYRYLATGSLSRDDQNLLQAACDACSRGVLRAHILDYQSNGVLLRELFTRDGVGTMINADDYEQVRQANLYDVNGIMELIQPMEEQGILVRRSRELLETEIDYFTVDVRDGAIIGCAALYPFPEDEAGELSCFAVRSDYRRFGRGDTLLSVIERKARQAGFKRLFVLTTQTSHWFIERGFQEVPVDQLPGPKRLSYNSERRSKVYMKPMMP